MVICEGFPEIKYTYLLFYYILQFEITCIFYYFSTIRLSLQMLSVLEFLRVSGPEYIILGGMKIWKTLQ